MNSFSPSMAHFETNAKDAVKGEEKQAPANGPQKWAGVFLHV